MNEPTNGRWMQVADTLAAPLMLLGGILLWKISDSPDVFFLTMTCAAGVLYVAYALTRRLPPDEFMDNDAYQNYRWPVAWWRDFFIIFLVLFVFRGMFYSWYYIPSNSMQPTLTVGDFVLVDRRRYGYRLPVADVRLSEGSAPIKGDIIVFHHPKSGVVYIKRLMATPGDIIALHPEGVFINGDKLPRNNMGTYEYQSDSGGKRLALRYSEELPDGWHYVLRAGNGAHSLGLPPDREYCQLTGEVPVLLCKVPPDRYFVMGDNRDFSNDSRFWGFVRHQDIIGPADLILFNYRPFFQSFAFGGNPLSLLSADEIAKDSQTTTEGKTDASPDSENADNAESVEDSQSLEDSENVDSDGGY